MRSRTVVPSPSLGFRRIAFASTIYGWQYVRVRVMPSVDGLSLVGGVVAEAIDNPISNAPNEPLDLFTDN
ncbi:hypothetical protein [Nocardia salmonicida]|uniref:hypothetical protein n=1 Tax=Nocardia salmonicida TaxID=53431 RepID=UPI001041F66C|nr:hypothetical protein [Nocardia salmonicida]